MNKIYYINELGYNNGYLKFETHRLPQAYMEYIPFYSIRYESIENEIKGNNNVIIFQTPTNDEFKKLQIINFYLKNNFVFITQESSIHDWFDWSADEQELYIKILSECKAFLYHNEYDKNVMKIFCDNFIKYTGCANQVVEYFKKFETGNYVLIPSPIKRFQRGMIVHKIATDNIKNIPIYSMNYDNKKNYSLSFPDSYKLNNIKLHDRVEKEQWLELIYNSKFGIDINRDFSGGNVSLEFASLGTPLIGNINLDIQRDLFPDLSFEFNDYDNIKKTINLLMNDKCFFEEVSNKSIINIKEKYNSFTVVEKFKQDLNKFL